MTDFFISYTRPDRPWATWIAWHLEAAGWTTVLDVWDFRPGHNWALAMQQAAVQAQRTLLVLSPGYFTALYPQAEWAAAFAADPIGTHGTLLPVRVRACTPPGLLRTLVYTDLVGLPEDAARAALLAGVPQGRGKPATAPPFPGSGTAPPPFPGSTAAGVPTLPTRLRRSWAWLGQHRAWVLGGLVLLLGLLDGMLAVRAPREVNTITAPAGPAVIQTGDGTVIVHQGEEKRP
jgi:hypothetical protein